MKYKEIGSACAGASMAVVLLVLSQIIRWSAIILHLFTVYMLWKVHGVLFACLGLVFPFAAEIYTFICCWIHFGFINIYSIAVLAVVVLYSLPWLIGLVAVAFSRKE